ncbi:hypothetical protein DPX16_19981 [Anabarilius grahami]|uniref:Uncharacterized protein n=1 Tax=Anabarilius grahami TaxID=495550 RepID=A0A3N0XQ48_ANAGA|nr:hypothetical protein DPX16_19981 [Anabarilius grahami]
MLFICWKSQIGDQKRAVFKLEKVAALYQGSVTVDRVNWLLAGSWHQQNSTVGLPLSGPVRGAEMVILTKISLTLVNQLINERLPPVSTAHGPADINNPICQCCENERAVGGVQLILTFDEYISGQNATGSAAKPQFFSSDARSSRSVWFWNSLQAVFNTHTHTQKNHNDFEITFRPCGPEDRKNCSATELCVFSFHLPEWRIGDGEKSLGEEAEFISCTVL